jgi:hypothetical protein
MPTKTQKRRVQTRWLQDIAKALSALASLALALATLATALGLSHLV